MIHEIEKTKKIKEILFERNGASLSAYIEDETIYLHSFHSILENRGYFTELLKEALEYLKDKYHGYGIYADCNIKGTIVSLKCGGQIDKQINRIYF